jgi:hypothetical protein
MNNQISRIERLKISLHMENKSDKWSETPLLYRNYLKENGTWQ